LHVLNRSGLRVNNQESTINEKRANESSIPKGKNVEKKNVKDSQVTRRNDENSEKESDFENSESDRESVKSVSTHPRMKSRKIKRRNRQKGGQDDDNNSTWKSFCGM